MGRFRSARYWRMKIGVWSVCGLVQTVVTPLWTCFLWSLLVHLAGPGLVVQADGIAQPAVSSSLPAMAFVAIGRCRVQCMKRIPLPTIAKSKANSTRQFRDCWIMCERWYTYPHVFQPLCNGKYCSGKGCKIACTFWNHAHNARHTTAEDRVWEFETQVYTDTDYVHINMEWDPPVSSPPVPHPHPLVYTLFMRENKDAWQLIDQTYEEQYVMPYDKAGFVPEFLLQAIDETGLIAYMQFDVDRMIYTNVLQPLPYDEVFDAEDIIHLNHTFTYDDERGLQLRLTWSHPDTSPHSAGGAGFEYEVVYNLVQCGIYTVVPRCNQAEDLRSATVPVNEDETPHYTIRDGLFFNTRYEVRIKQDHQTPNPTVLAFLEVITPRCHMPSQDFRHCYDVNFNTTVTPGGADNDVTTASDSSHAVDVVTGVGSDAEVDAEVSSVDHGDRHPADLIQKVDMKLLPHQNLHQHQRHSKGRGEGDKEGEEEGEGEVLVNVTWTYLSDPCQVNFSLTLMRFDEEEIRVRTETIQGVTHFVTSVLTNTLYEVMVELIMPVELPMLNDTRQEGHHHFGGTRQRRLFNTSQLQLATRERHQASTMQEQSPLKTVNGVIIGVTCVCVLVVIAVIIAFLYKKRQSFKGFIIPKTTVAKSNSYKSSVGGKADYSNQLMVFCDEWELDPQYVKFSTPLGQGAFGKVVTGYYADHRVAIKLVKEGAPTSYREDLVAEINLMKRLGSHPNIVCLVGACTISEPIALIMEYVPYGNLQNFLKKCRMEGDLQKQGNGPSEIHYSMLQECGGIENGVVTPTDMLSFARQVAMAMEYLAEKKYVHRDLAARNILLHYNKVVKVCDFGLSRDIFHDNQYKKLTNGKLPLKWMAIESLRDRIFTTQSDVWSFGILLWEIVTMGASPYPNIALADLYYVLSNHYRMDKPSNCSNELYGMMRTCWADSAGDRPTFTQLREQLEALMSMDRDYLVLEDIDVPLSTSESSSNPTASDLFSGEMLPSQSARQAVSVSSSGSSTTASSSGLIKQGCPANRRPMTIDVCIHQKSTERLMRPSESDSSP